MRHKNQKPPICIGGSEKLRAMDRPRYMNVPSPAPCHVNVAGVGKQSVWGLRVIAKSQLSHDSRHSSTPKSGGQAHESHVLADSLSRSSKATADDLALTHFVELIMVWQTRP